MSDLFEYRHAVRLPDTSVAAIASLAPALGPIAASVLSAIKGAGSGGLTTNEVAQQIRIDRGTVQPRTSELKLLGLITDSGQRRFNANGKRAIVWVAKEDRQHG